MRKVTALILIVAFALLASPAFASDIPDTLKSKVVTSDEVLTTGGGWLVYSFRVYAAAASSEAALYNCDTVGACASTNIKSENGEATQYDISDEDAIGGDKPIEFSEGLTCLVNNGYAIILYED